MISNLPFIFQILTVKNIFRKIVWLLILVFSIWISAYHIKEKIDFYREYQVVIDVNFKHEKNTTFPSVTLCNLNRFSSLFLDCLRKKEPVRKCTILRSPPLYSLFIPERKLYHICNITDNLSSTTAGIILNSYLNETVENRKFMTYKSHKFFKYCSFYGEKCSFQDFTEIYSLRYGICFVFNGYKKRKVITNNFGNKKGLDVVVDIRSDEYYAPLSPSLGIKVLIHSPGDNLNIEEKGFYAPPMYDTVAVVKKVITKRLPTPYSSKCKHYKTLSISQDTCVKYCIQHHNFNRCGCVDPTILQKEYENKSCNLTINNNVCCLDEVLDDLRAHKINCECPLPCVSISYELQISRSFWPDASFFPGFGSFEDSGSFESFGGSGSFESFGGTGSFESFGGNGSLGSFGGSGNFGGFESFDGSRSVVNFESFGGSGSVVNFESFGGSRDTGSFESFGYPGGSGSLGSFGYPGSSGSLGSFGYPGSSGSLGSFGYPGSSGSFGSFGDSRSDGSFRRSKRQIIDGCKPQRCVRLKVTIEGSEVKVFEEKPKYIFTELLSNIGGDLSLYLGFTILIIFELLEILHCIIHKSTTYIKLIYN